MSRKKGKTDKTMQQASRPQNITQVQQIFQRAQQLQQGGYLNEAENLYRQILATDPKQPDCLHYLGLVYMQKGLPEQAADYMQQSIKYSNNPVFLCNYGLILSQGKHEEAIKQYRKALQIRPDYAEAWFNLGVSYSSIGKPELAEDAYKNAVKNRNNYIKALYNLACVQEMQGRMIEGRNTLEKILKISPVTAEEHNMLGLALSRIGGVGNLKQAEKCFRTALEQRPGYPDAYINLGKLFNEGNQVEDAISCYSTVLEHQPEHLEARLGLADSLIINNQLEEAGEILKKILGADAHNARALCGLGNIKRISGDFDAAVKIYKQVLDINNTEPYAYFGLATCRKYTDEDREFIDSIKNVASVSAITNFALGKIYNDIGDYDEAFDYYKKANVLRNNRITYNAAENTELTNRIMAVFSHEFFESIQFPENHSRLPVFILGAPRSGTTLAEQIVSSHPEVYGGGELRYIPQLINKIKNNNTTGMLYPECILDLEDSDLSELGAEYIEKLRSHTDDDNIKRITDKMPGNFRNIGFIYLLFPEASVIHCRRNPLDTCLSIYFQSFSSGHQYSFDLENLGNWYRDYARLMDYWKQLLPGYIQTVDYDEMVNNTEAEARKMVDKCGLEWDSKCLDFHRDSRSVHTASTWQVRQPIYKTSLQRWKRYDKHIGPLKEILSGYY